MRILVLCALVQLVFGARYPYDCDDDSKKIERNLIPGPGEGICKCKVSVHHVGTRALGPESWSVFAHPAEAGVLRCGRDDDCARSCKTMAARATSRGDLDSRPSELGGRERLGDVLCDDLKREIVNGTVTASSDLCGIGTFLPEVKFRGRLTCIDGKYRGEEMNPLAGCKVYCNGIVTDKWYPGCKTVCDPEVVRNQVDPSTLAEATATGECHVECTDTNDDQVLVCQVICNKPEAVPDVSGRVSPYPGSNYYDQQNDWGTLDELYPAAGRVQQVILRSNYYPYQESVPIPAPCASTCQQPQERWTQGCQQVCQQVFRVDPIPPPPVIPSCASTCQQPQERWTPPCQQVCQQAIRIEPPPLPPVIPSCASTCQQPQERWTPPCQQVCQQVIRIEPPPLPPVIPSCASTCQQPQELWTPPCQQVCQQLVFRAEPQLLPPPPQVAPSCTTTCQLPRTQWGPGCQLVCQQVRQQIPPQPLPPPTHVSCISTCEQPRAQWGAGCESVCSKVYRIQLPPPYSSYRNEYYNTYPVSSCQATCQQPAQRWAPPCTSYCQTFNQLTLRAARVAPPSNNELVVVPEPVALRQPCASVCQQPRAQWPSTCAQTCQQQYVTTGGVETRLEQTVGNNNCRVVCQQPAMQNLAGCRAVCPSTRAANINGNCYMDCKEPTISRIAGCGLVYN